MLVGSPTPGIDSNAYFQGVQINFSKCQTHEDATQLNQGLGHFGEMHIDKDDHPAYLTNILIISDLPPSYHPGIFMFYELGAYIRMDPLVSANFSGLRYHGGTSPTPPLGQKPAAWAYRLVHISYPAKSIIDMSSRQAIATLPGGETLYLTPEMMEHLIPQEKYNYTGTPANHIIDGVGMMSRDAHVQHVYRMMLRVRRFKLLIY
jgi:hypothetical protein